MLPFVCREIIEGNVPEVVVNASEWAKLASYLRTLPGGSTGLAFAVADAPEPLKPEASERAVAARKLGELVRVVGASSPFGADVLREESGRYYAVPFAYGSLVVGLVRLYSLGYVMVSYVAHTDKLPPEGLPKVDSRVFAGIDDAARFLTLALHKRQYAEALAVPLKQLKPRPGQPT